MNNRKTGSLLAAIALCAALAGCGQPSSGTVQGGGNTEPAAGVTAMPSPQTTDKPAPTESAMPEQKIEVDIYSSDTDLTELTKRIESISYTTEQELVDAVIKKLMEDGNENQRSLWKKIELKQVQFSQDNVTIDVHVPDSARLGSPGEALLIESLKETLFQLKFIDSIQLLVDGEQAESLMGHIELEHPMNRS